MPWRQVTEILATVGITLPYLVGTLGTVCFKDRIGMAAYASGQMNHWDEVTTAATLVALLVGAALAFPAALRVLRRARKPKVLGATLLFGLCAHAVLVFVVRFVVYYQSGGVL